MKLYVIGASVIVSLLGCQSAPKGPEYALPSHVKESEVAWLQEQLGATVKRVDGKVPLRDSRDGEDDDEAVVLAPGRVAIEAHVASRGGEGEQQGAAPLVFEAGPGKTYRLGRIRDADRAGAFQVTDVEGGHVVAESQVTEVLSSDGQAVWGVVPAAAATETMVAESEPLPGSRSQLEPEPEPEPEAAAAVEPQVTPSFEPATLSAPQFRWFPLYTIYLRVVAVDGIAGDRREARSVRLAPGHHEVEVLFRVVELGEEDENEESTTVETRHLLALEVEEGAEYRLQGIVKEGERWLWVQHQDTKEIVAGEMP